MSEYLENLAWELADFILMTKKDLDDQDPRYHTRPCSNEWLRMVSLAKILKKEVERLRYSEAKE